jgi:hypothetical protein
VSEGFVEVLRWPLSWRLVFSELVLLIPGQGGSDFLAQLGFFAYVSLIMGDVTIV